MQGLTQKTLSGLFWLGSSSGAKAIIKIIVIGLLARLLEPGDFGVVAAAMVVIVFTEMIYEMGVGPALIQLENIGEKHIHTAFTFSLGLGVSLILLFYQINPFIAAFYEMPELLDVLNLLLWVFPIRTISHISYSLLQREMLFKRLAGLDLISYLLGFGVMGLILALNGFGVWSLVWANLTEALIYCILLLVRTYRKLGVGLDITALKELLRFGSGFTIAAILNFFARKADYIIVGKYIGGAGLGIYSRAYGLMNAPNSIVGSVANNVLFAGFSKIQADGKRMLSALEKSYSLIFLSMLPLSGISIILAPEIILVLLGEKWMASIMPFQVLVFSMFFRVGYKIGGTYLKSVGKTKVLAFTQGIYAIGVTLGSYLGLAWGINGVAVGVTLAIILNFFLLTFYIINDTYLQLKSLMNCLQMALPLFIIASVLVFGVKLMVMAITENAFIVLPVSLLIAGIILLILIRQWPGFIVGRSNLLILQQFKFWRKYAL